METNLPTNQKNSSVGKPLTMHSVSISRIANNQSVITSRQVKELTWNNKDWTNIKTIVKNNGDDYVLSIVTYLLTEALGFVGHNLTPKDTINYAEMFMNQWEYWSIDDVTMCLRNGITGQYGKSNKNFSYETLTDWANKFEDSRLDYLESPERRNKESTDIHHRLSPKMDGPTPIIIPAHLKTAKEIDEHLNKVKK